MNARDKAIGVLIALSAAGVLPASSGFLRAQAVPDAEAEAPARIIFEGATVIDGTGAPPRTGMAIVLEGEEIVAVLPVGDLGAERRDGAEVVDAGSWFAIPGLIESHTHVATMANRARAEFILNRQLYGGITTARDMAGDVRSLMDLQRASLVKEIDAPDLRFAALMAGPEFFTDPRTVSSAAGETPGAVTWMQAVTEETDLREAVTLARGTWATGIKTYAAIDGDLLAAIAAEARRQGIPVWAHVHVGPARSLEVARAGVRAMSHVCDVGSAAIPDDVFQEGQEGLRSGFVDVDLDDPAIDSVFAAMWRNETSTRKAEEMKKAGLELEKRLEIFLGHFADVGSQLARTNAVYNAAAASAESRLTPHLRKLRELGGQPEETGEDRLPKPVEMAPRRLFGDDVDVVAERELL